MNYKEKYKKSLERASKLKVQNPFDTVGQMVEHIFPELKESEDEKIKREIIAYINELADLKNEKIPTNWLAWLEKKRQKFEESEVSVTESKPQPRFKEGNWITDGRLICKVLGVTGKSYELHLHNDDYCHFETDIQSVDKCYRLWTIQDAKDGDVLVGKDDRPFIFTGEFDVQDDNPTAYCGINSNDKFITGKGSHWTFKDGIKPATKEQRKLLFSKMRETGYEWDAGKKELKKIEAPKQLNADEVIEWLKENVSDFTKYIVVDKFKEHFEL